MSNQFTNSPKLVQAKRINKKVKFVIVIFLLSVLAIAAALVYILFFSNSNSASFKNNDKPQKIIKGPELKTFETNEFKITLPDSWDNNGTKNPFSNEYYYEFQDKNKVTNARYLRVYLNNFPPNYPITRALLVDNLGNKLKSLEVSGECRNLPGAPKGTQSLQNWQAAWKDSSFTCDLVGQTNYIGTINRDSGYSLPLVGSSSGNRNNYFLVYIDNTPSPNERIFIDAINTFEVI